MFYRLAGRNETGIDRRAFAEFLDRLLTLGDDAIDRLAGLGLGPLADHLEHLLKTLDLALRLLTMRRKGLLEFRLFGRLHHLGERAENLLFREVNILQVRQKQVVQCFLKHGYLLVTAEDARGDIWFRCERHHAGWNTTFTQPSFFVLKV